MKLPSVYIPFLNNIDISICQLKSPYCIDRFCTDFYYIEGVMRTVFMMLDVSTRALW